MKTELEKLEQKRAIYKQGMFLLSQDSLTNEVINPEFEAIDKGVNTAIKREIYITRVIENNLIEQIRAGQKIELRGIF